MASSTFSPPRPWSSLKSSSATIQLCRSVKRTVFGSTSGCASASSMAIRRTSVHFMSLLLHHINGVLGYLHHQILVPNHRLATQARGRLHAPSFVQHIFLQVFGRNQRFEPLADDHVACGASA